MFDLENNKDITEDLVLSQLIEETKACTSYMWERKNYSTYTQYLFTHKLTEKSSICFRVHHQKTHDRHLLNVYLSRERGTRYISIICIEGIKVLDLIKTIEDTRTFYYEPD